MLSDPLQGKRTTAADSPPDAIERPLHYTHLIVQCGAAAVRLSSARSQTISLHLMTVMTYDLIVSEMFLTIATCDSLL